MPTNSLTIESVVSKMIYFDQGVPRKAGTQAEDLPISTIQIQIKVRIELQRQQFWEPTRFLLYTLSYILLQEYQGIVTLNQHKLYWPR